jgi:nitrogen fixation protein NifU and related proteins
MKYSQKVMEHFANPRNVGSIENADGVGEVGNPACGDIMTFTIRVRDGRLEDVKFQTFGCGAAIAVSSMISDMAKGRTLDEALAITNQAVAEALDGLPTNKLHCSNLGADALHAAIRDYQARQTKPAPGTQGAGERGSVEPGPDKLSCRCVYCNIDNPKGAPFCGRCGARLEGGS